MIKKVKRPLGVTIFAILQFLIGASYLFQGFSAIIIEKPFGFDWYNGILLFLSLALLFFGSVFFYSGLALLKLHHSGRDILIILAWCNILSFSIHLLFEFQDLDFISYIPSLIYTVAVFSYFYRSKIKKIFSNKMKSRKS